MATSLFPPRQTSSHLIQFRAGRCFRDEDGSNWVRPAATKGTFFMEMQDDELLHVCWRDRETKVVGDDFIVFPGDAVFAKVPQSSGRVYSLKFTSSGEVHFYWLQFKNREKDASIEESVNALIDDPDALGGAMQGMGGDMAGAEQLMQLLNANMRQQAGGDTLEVDDEVEYHGDEANQPLLSSTGNAPTPRLSREETLNTLRNMISETQAQGSTEATEGAISLEDVLTIDTLRPILQDAETRRALFPHLPEGASHTEQEIVEIISSAPFKRALSSLSVALSSGQLGPLATSLGLRPEAGLGVREFILAISERAKQKQDEAMDTDQ